MNKFVIPIAITVAVLSILIYGYGIHKVEASSVLDQLPFQPGKFHNSTEIASIFNDVLFNQTKIDQEQQQLQNIKDNLRNYEIQKYGHELEHDY